MRFKDWLLSEEIYPNRTATVYHRTHEPTTIANIIRSGFRPGPRCFHGCGLYSTYLIDAQFMGDMDRSYGKYIMEYKVTDLDKYLIFEASEAKKIHGANWRLSSQIRLLSPSLTKAIENAGMSFYDLDRKQSEARFSSALSRDLHKTFKLDSHGLRGIVYFGETDGPCLLKYEPINEGSEIVLLRYAYAPIFKGRENLQWIKDTNLASLRTHSLYRKKFAEKEFFLSGDPLEKLIATNDISKIKLLLKKGIQVRREHLLKAIRSKSKELKDLIVKNADWDDIEDKDFDLLFNNFDDQNALAEKIILNKKNWTPTMTLKIMSANTFYQIDPNKIAKLIISQRSKLSAYEVEGIFHNVSEKDDIAEHIIKTRSIISTAEIEGIMKNVRNPDRFAKLIIDKNPGINEDSFFTLVYFSSERDEIAKLLFDKKGFLTDFEIERLMEDAQDPIDIAEFIVDRQEKLSDSVIISLVRGQQNEDRNYIAQRILSKLDVLEKELFENLIEKLGSAVDDKTLELMIKKADFEFNQVFDIMKRASDKDSIAELILSKNPEPSISTMWEILQPTKNKKHIADLIGSENISRIDNPTILTIMKFINDKKIVAEIFLDKHENLNDNIRKKLERTAAGEENVFK